MSFYTRGLAWDGTYLWVSTGKFKTLHKLDANMQVVQIYETTLPLAGITFANGALWGIEANNNQLHRFEIHPSP